MPKKALLNNIIALASLIIVLATTFGIDRWILFLRKENSTTFALNSVLMWSYAIAALVWAGMLLLLFWYMVYRGSRNWLVGCIYLLLGLVQTLFPVLYLSPMGNFWIFLSPYLATSSEFMRRTGGFVTIIGGCVLMLSLRRSQDEAEQKQSNESI